jgi:hypothetical protein
MVTKKKSKIVALTAAMVNLGGLPGEKYKRDFYTEFDNTTGLVLYSDYDENKENLVITDIFYGYSEAGASPLGRFQITNTDKANSISIELTGANAYIYLPLKKPLIIVGGWGLSITVNDTYRVWYKGYVEQK